MIDIILASGSPRRKELLTTLQLPFTILVSDVDETIDNDIHPHEAVMELAARKANIIAKKQAEALIVGADTVVALGNDILGKPKDVSEAKSMLQSLSGKKHTVYTGVCLCWRGKERRFYERTEVLFWELSEQIIMDYIDSGSPFDKAGGYGIQDAGALFVRRIEGDYYNVVGLPISRLHQELISIDADDAKLALFT
jgi:septum formation protein